jgi:hypothetical protein
MVGQGSGEAGQTDASALARDNGRIGPERARQPLHRSDGVPLLNGHEAVGDARQHPPGDQRRLVAFEHRHDGRLALFDSDRTPGACALVDARGSRRLDHDEHWPLIRQRHREMAGDRSRDSADAGLHEDMRRRLGELTQRLTHHGRIALHHERRNVLISRPGCVGDDRPAILGRDSRRFLDGVVISARHPDDLGAETRNRVNALLADAGMDEDHRSRADKRRALRHGTPVVAVGRTGEGHRGGDGANIGRVERGDINDPTQPLRSRIEHEPDDRVGAAQSLEAAEAESAAFVLDVDRAYPELAREGRKRMQGGDEMVFAMAQESLDFLRRRHAQGLGVPRVEGQAIIAVPVSEKHGRLS